MKRVPIPPLLKQLRSASGLSGRDVARKLALYGISLSEKTLYGYENGVSMPNADVFLALCSIYDCEGKHWWRARRADSEALDLLVWEQPQDQGVWEQVAALPKPHRLALYLHYYQGYTTGEIGDMLGENPSTVRSRLAQARKKLKLKLEEEGYGQA